MGTGKDAGENVTQAFIVAPLKLKKPIVSHSPSEVWNPMYCQWVGSSLGRGIL